MPTVWAHRFKNRCALSPDTAAERSVLCPYRPFWPPVLFLGGLLLYPLVRLDEVLAPVSILLCLLGGAGLLISYFSAVRRLLFQESYITPNSDHHKEDSHENT